MPWSTPVGEILNPPKAVEDVEAPQTGTYGKLPPMFPDEFTQML